MKIKITEYQCPECKAIVPKNERQQFVNIAKVESITVCIDCYDRLANEANPGRADYWQA